MSIHAAMTDHRILRRQPPRDLMAPLAERHDVEGSYRGEVDLYYPASLPASADRDLYLAIAQVAQKSNLESGIPQLEAALRTHQPSLPEFYLPLAQALLAVGRRDQAIAAYRSVLKSNPQFVPALRGLGEALERARAIRRAPLATLESRLAHFSREMPPRSTNWASPIMNFGRTYDRCIGYRGGHSFGSGLARDSQFAGQHVTRDRGPAIRN